MLRKLRLALTKGEELRFLSHLDFSQAVERTIRRAGIRMAYSEGFNPHMKISFSSALALGITASREYVDMDTVDEDSLENIIIRFNNNAPKGLKVIEGKIMTDERVKKMMAICNYAIYEVTGPVTSEVDWKELLKSFNDAHEIAYEKITPKKIRTIDIKHFIKGPITAVVHDNHTVTLVMGIGIYPEGTVKPSEVWKLGKRQFGWPVTDAYEVHRKDILIANETGLYTPLEI